MPMRRPHAQVPTVAVATVSEATEPTTRARMPPGWNPTPARPAPPAAARLTAAARAITAVATATAVTATAAATVTEQDGARPPALPSPACGGRCPKGGWGEVRPVSTTGHGTECVRTSPH